MKFAITRLLMVAFILSAFATVSSADAADPLPKAPPAPKFTEAERHAELARRRAAVAAKMADNSVLVLFSAEPKLYTNDVDYVYRQENNFYYLTGLKQENATLVIAKNGGKVTETLFLPKRVAVREAWEGKMYSREQATQVSGLNTIVDGSEKDAFLDAVKARGTFTSKDKSVTISGTPTLYLLLPGSDDDDNGKREFRVEHEMSKALTEYKVENAQPIFAELRHVKSPYELKLLQHAIDITTEAQLRSMAMVGRAQWEYEVHAEVEYTFRRRNADFWGYPSIVGCGSNATTLHYVESQSPIKKGELLLMDVGAEYEHYTADVTRTYPVNGKFTKEQAEIYQIVYDAQEAVAKATKPGTTYIALGGVAREVVRNGLAKVGLITAPNATYQIMRDGKPFDVPQASLWNFHGLGHWLGMNVHDVGSYQAPLTAGMVFTNEPGIYIREDALDYMPDTPANREFKAKIKQAYEKYRTIGVRIEDDMLVTETGVEWMTGKLPRKISDIEAFMAKASKEFNWTSLNTTLPTTVFLDAGIRSRAE
ncbi:MAG TPA: aminopeptidase P family protein [Pyrinomonadaceae bacterium]|nr:aminopeptidase P family protein [Pyrinomonadaceae bacterium]